MELQNAVKEALQALYHHPDDSVRTQADRWLQDFQHTLDAWQVADNLLHDPTSNLETLIFCSQMLKSKVQRDLEELPSGALIALRDSLIKLLKKFHKGPPRVRTQICIAMAALAVQVPAKDLGDGGIISWINNEMHSHSEFAPSFLEILAVLPEEASNYKIAAHPDRRHHFEEELISSVETTLNILTVCLDVNNLKEQVLEAFASWLRLKHGIHASKLASHPLVLSALSGLHSDPLSEASVNVISQLIQLTATESSNDMHAQMPLIRVIVPQVMKLKEQLKDPSKGEDDVKAVARLFADIGDSYVPLIASGSDESMVIINAMLEVTSHPDYDIFSMTLSFWQNLQHILTRRDPSYHGDVQSIQAEIERRIEFFRPSYESLISMLCFHIQFPHDYEDLSTEDLKDFKQARSAVADVFHNAAIILGGEATLRIFYFKLLEAVALCQNIEGHGEWRPAEAILFCIRSISTNIPPFETEVVPQIMDLLPKFPAHSQLLETVCLTIGAYSFWLDSAPNGFSKFPPLIEILLNGMRMCENTAAAASLAFRQICAACGNKLFGYMEGLFQIYHVAISRDSGLKVSPGDSLHLVEALSTMISELPLDHAKKALEALCFPIATPLEELSKQGLGMLDKQSARELIVNIDRLGNIFRYVNHPEAVAGAIHGFWPTFKLIFQERAWDMRTMESICRACKYAVRTSGGFMGIIIGEMMQEIQLLYKQHHQSCFLYLSSEVIKIFGSEVSCAEYLKNLIEALFGYTTSLLTKIEDFTSRPDIADDCFLLASRCIRYCPHLFIPSAAFAPLIDCSMIGITVMHREASKSILSFLTDVFDVKASTVGEQLTAVRDNVIVPRGASLTRILIAALTGALPPSRLETVSDALVSLMRAYGDRALQWVKETMSLIPLTAVTQAERSRFLHTLSDVAGGVSFRNAMPAIEELSDVCRRNRTVEELVQSVLRVHESSW